jgi:hypothetical protein
MSTADEIAKLHALFAATPGPGAGLAINRLRLAQGDKWIAGVCGGIARLSGVS